MRAGPNQETGLNMNSEPRSRLRMTNNLERDAKRQIADGRQRRRTKMGGQASNSDDGFNPDTWLKHAAIGFAEPAPSQWGTIPGCARLESERLYIHCYRIIPNEDDGWCTLYIGTLKDFSITPRAIVSMIA